MSKITLTDLANLQNETTAVSAINANNAVIETAFDNTISRDGTSPNQMQASLDMNSNRILNLPAPASATEPLRFGDVNASGLVYSGGTNISVAGTTISTIANPTFATSVTTPQIKNSTGIVNIPSSGTITIPAVTDTLVAKTTTDTLTNKTLTSPVISTIVNTGTLTLPTSTDTLVGKATTDTLTNKTINTAGTGNHIQISGVDLTRGQILGEASTGNASAGNIGEYITITGSGVAMTSGTNFNATATSITAGDWDIWGFVQFGNAGATTYSMVEAGLSTTNNVFTGVVTQIYTPATAGATYSIPVTMGRFSFASTTTVFLVGLSNFTGGAPTAGGTLYARRAR